MSLELYVSIKEKQVYTDNGYETRNAVTGFFTSPSEGLEKITPVCLENTPDSGKICVVTASGNSFYMDKNGECVENAYEVGPIYARNLQSAFSALFGKIKRDLTLESCLLYEIDHDYSDTEPEDILSAKLTSELFKEISSANGKLSDDLKMRDYIAELTEFDEENPAFKAKLSSKELKNTAAHIMQIAESNAAEAANGKKAVCDPGADEALKMKLARTFTTRELSQLDTWSNGGEAPNELVEKALSTAPKFKIKTSFFEKLFGKKQ